VLRTQLYVLGVVPSDDVRLRADSASVAIVASDHASAECPSFLAWSHLVLVSVLHIVRREQLIGNLCVILNGRLLFRRLSLVAIAVGVVGIVEALTSCSSSVPHR
jgi:hypothetical protein